MANAESVRQRFDLLFLNIAFALHKHYILLSNIEFFSPWEALIKGLFGEKNHHCNSVCQYFFFFIACFLQEFLQNLTGHKMKVVSYCFIECKINLWKVMPHWRQLTGLFKNVIVLCDSYHLHLVN